MAKIFKFKQPGEACINCVYYVAAPATELNENNVKRCCSYGLSINSDDIIGDDANKLNTVRNPDHWCSKYMRLQSRKISDLYKVFSRAALKGCRDFIDDEKSRCPHIIIDEKFIFTLVKFLNGSKLKRKQDRRTLNRYVLGTHGFTFPGHNKYNKIFKYAESLPDTYLKSRTIYWGKNVAKPNLVNPTDETFSRFLKGLLIFLRWYESSEKYPAEPSEFSCCVDNPDYELNSGQRAVILSQNAVNSVSLNSGDFERYILRLAIKEMNQGRLVIAIELLDYLLSSQGFFQKLKENRVNPKALIIRSIASVIEHDGPAALQYLHYLPADFKNIPEIKKYIKLCDLV